MNEQELNYQIEANDFSDELSDEALDRGDPSACGSSKCICGVIP